MFDRFSLLIIYDYLLFIDSVNKFISDLTESSRNKYGEWSEARKDGNISTAAVRIHSIMGVVSLFPPPPG